MERIETAQTDLRVQSRFAELIPRQWGQCHTIEDGGDQYLINVVSYSDPAQLGFKENAGDEGRSFVQIAAQPVRLLLVADEFHRR